MSLTPLGVIQSLSQETERNTRACKNSNSEFTPWNDKYAFPFIKNKNENHQKRQKLIRKKINQSVRIQNHSLENFIKKKKFTKTPTDFKNTVRYTTLDISKIPYYYSTQRNQEQTLSPYRFCRTYNSSKKYFNSDIVSFQGPKSSIKHPYFKKQEQRNKILKRRKQNKPKYSGLVTNQFIYSQQNSYESKKTFIINYPIQTHKQSYYAKKSTNKIMTIYDSFVSRQKCRLIFNETRKQNSQQRKQTRGLSQLLEISESLLSKDFKYY